MKKIIILTLIIMLTACSTHISDISVISTKNINLEEININRIPQRKLVTGKDKKFIFLVIPFGIPKIKGAVNDALEKGNGDLMIDASLYWKGWWFIVGYSGFEIKGNVVNIKGGVNE